MMTFRRSLCTLILLITAVAAFAQWEDEYRMEIGGGVGMMSYEGDYNGSITSNMEPMGSVLLRRVFNPYMALAATVSYGKLKGSLRDVATYYPEQQNLPVSFSNQLVFAMSITSGLMAQDSTTAVPNDSPLSCSSDWVFRMLTQAMEAYSQETCPSEQESNIRWEPV